MVAIEAKHKLGFILLVNNVCFQQVVFFMTTQYNGRIAHERNIDLNVTMQHRARVTVTLCIVCMFLIDYECTGVLMTTLQVYPNHTNWSVIPGLFTAVVI